MSITSTEIELREEIAVLKDKLTRTEAFANSLLDEGTEIDISVTRTPINIPAKDARTMRVFEPKKVDADDWSHVAAELEYFERDGETLTRLADPAGDYDRAMSLVGK